VSAAERRSLINGEKSANARIADLLCIIPAINGKVELVYEGEQEGPQFVALRLIGLSIRRKFPQIFPSPETFKRKKQESPYEAIIQWFSNNDLDMPNDMSQKEYALLLYSVPTLGDLVKKYCPGLGENDRLIMMEFLLHGLAEFSLIGKSVMDSSISFSDVMNQLFDHDDDES
jgi:magnesium chelatase subunit I